MKKIHLDSGKLHKTARFRYGITGTLCLILAAVLLYVQWGGQLLEARAAGEITYSAKDGLWSEGLKNGTQSGDLTKVTITGMEKPIAGSVKDTEATLYTNSVTKTYKVENENENQTISADYLEDASLSFRVQYNLGNSKGNTWDIGKWTWSAERSDGSQITGESTRNAFYVKAVRTYYNLVTEDKVASNKDSFSDFENTVRGKFREEFPDYTVSDRMLMTNKDGGRNTGYGRAFGAYIEAYMTEKNYKQYNDGVKLPLYVDGKRVVRIDMLTVTEADFYLYEDKTGVSFRADYDVAVYKKHSYSMTNTAAKAADPTAVLESGTSLSAAETTGISADDRLTEMKPGETGLTGIYEYCVSDQQITDKSKISWNTWDGRAVALAGKKYLYLRMTPQYTSGTYTNLRLPSDAAEYRISYLNKAAAPAKAALSDDSVSFTTTQSGGQIFYTTDGADAVFTKVQGSTLIASLKAEAEKEIYSKGILSYSGKSYVRVNGLWYECGANVSYYDKTAVALDYSTNRQYAELRTCVLADGCAVDNVNRVHRYQKLNPPAILLESGSAAGSTALIPGDRIVTVTVTNPYPSTHDYYEDYEAEVKKVKVEYAFSATRIMDTDSITSWTQLPSLPADLPTGDGYIYLKLVPSGNTGTKFDGVYVESEVREYALSYTSNPMKPEFLKLEIEPDITVKDTDEDGTGTLKLSSTVNNTVIVYSLAGEISVERVDDTTLRKALDAQAAGRAAAYTEYGNHCYIRANGLWYRCGEKGTVKGTGGEELKASELAAGLTVHALAMADGYSGTAVKERTIQSMKAPTVTLESGKTAGTDTVSPDEVLTEIKSTASAAGLEYQYLLTDRKLDTVSDVMWGSWTGSPVALAGSKYLYVRAKTPEDSTHLSSPPRRYELKYLTDKPAGVTAKAYVKGQVITGGVDYGDEIELIELKSAENKAIIFYTTDGKQPSFTKLAAGDSNIAELEQRLSDGTASLNGKLYLKLNGLWYECGADTLLYNKQTRIVVDETIYTDNYLEINAQAVVEGKVFGTTDRFSYGFSLREQVATPVASVANGATVQIGDTVNLICGETNSRIFYTTNGSAPVVNIVNGKVELGAETKEFITTPIQISTDFASYGSSVTITAVACRFKEYAAGMARTKRDSELARFTYSVGAQAAVEPVTSVPTASSDKRTEVTIGSKIRLFSATEGAVIFYTLDGSEPAFDETTLKPTGSSTLKYDATQGITVPPITDSSVITITAVAWCEGLASSNISRLIFQYPSAVSAPYATPAAGAVAENTQVSLKTATEGAAIYYTTDGSTPTTASNVYDSTNPFVISKNTTIKALAVKDKMESEVVTFAYTVSEKLSTPQASIESGSVVAAGTVVTLTGDSGATIHYTTDGSDPKKTDNQKVLIGNSVIISGNAGDVITVQAYATKTGYSDSETGYYSYSISSYEGGIFADRPTGSTVKNGDVIQLNSDVSGADIFYTTDGSTPTRSSASGSRVTIQGTPGENITIKAIAVASGTDRAVSAATFTYTIMNRLAAPTSSVPTGAVFTKKSAIQLTAETGSIYYTTDGTQPSTASNLYKDGVVITGAVTIKAIAVAENYEQSEVSSFTYGFADQVEAPKTSYASGELEMGTEVEFTCGTEGASIYYRTDGADPNLKEKDGLELYTGPVTVNRATTFKIMAVKEELQDSKVVTVGYTVREPEIIQNTDETDTEQELTETGRLKSRRSFSDTQSGPSYTDVVLKNAVYGVVVASKEGSLPDSVQLDVKQVQASDAAERMVKQLVSESYGIVDSYDVTLLVNGETVQPDGEIEIGLPIPAAYENSLIQVAYVTEDGSVELYETRRSGGVAYIKTNHLSVYAITAPVEFAEAEKETPWLLIGYSGAVLLLGIGIWLLYRAKKIKREGRAKHGE
ncbi:Predicted RNA-binding protein%2C contains TRAM domain [uncultured Clostridium sp.]|nr:Predicted RNA-binding protein%2C contains TRAM domain [uncultured Clostridium sp.]